LRARKVTAESRRLSYDREISPRDKMLMGTPDNYFHWGLAALDCIRAALSMAEVEDPPRRILDLPCGHGRVLRMLAAAYPRADLIACDLDSDGVDFCARTFGATPVYSHNDPDQIGLPVPFDLIWVGSLLTHVSASRWSAFLRLFAGHLEPGGVVVFTTHGRGIVDELRRGENTVAVAEPASLVADVERVGFGYQDYSRVPDYGISVSLPHWVCRELQEHPRLELVTYTEGGWNSFQDAVACRRVQT
jgi:SAM-dependent methyltransferase